LYNHAPGDYACPLCRIVREIAADENTDLVFQDEVVTAFMSLHDSPNNLGHVIVIPNEHYENIFDLPTPLAARIHECSRAVSLAMKTAYHCDGISIRQHNEPAGGQDVWHYHLHVYPRYEGDGFSRAEKVITPKEKRVELAALLRPHLRNWTDT
jgi:histidine triad (HIT) family protein